MARTKHQIGRSALEAAGVRNPDDPEYYSRGGTYTKKAIAALEKALMN